MAKIIDSLCIATTVVLLAVSVMDTSGFGSSLHQWINLLHLGSFSFLFGVQLWTVAVAGIVMIKTLPRHMFGLVQSALFPAFFGVCVMTSFLTLTAMLLRYPYAEWSTTYTTQVITVGSVGAINVIQRVFLGPKNIQIMDKMFMLEREAGAGNDVGPVKNEELTANADYRQIKKRFGMYHGMSNLAGLLSLVASAYHCYYVARSLGI